MASGVVFGTGERSVSINEEELWFLLGVFFWNHSHHGVYEEENTNSLITQQISNGRLWRAEQ